VAGGYKARLGAPALNTLVHRIAVLSKAHQLAQQANPCGDPLVRELLARTRRAYAQRGARPRKQRALTKDPLQALLATCDETLRGKRDRALLLFAWATGGRRRSEAAAATMENLRRIDARSSSVSYLYTLAHSKTNQTGVDDDRQPIVNNSCKGPDRSRSPACISSLRGQHDDGPPWNGSASYSEFGKAGNLRAPQKAPTVLSNVACALGAKAYTDIAIRRQSGRRERNSERGTR
jgi:hypothetical protein